MDTLHEHLCTFLTKCTIGVRMGNVSDKSLTNKTTHVLGSIVFLIILVKYCTAGHATDNTQYIMAHALFMPDSQVHDTDTN